MFWVVNIEFESLDNSTTWVGAVTSPSTTPPLAKRLNKLWILMMSIRNLD